jgi:hypothetical protein
LWGYSLKFRPYIYGIGTSNLVPEMAIDLMEDKDLGEVLGC